MSFQNDDSDNDHAGRLENASKKALETSSLSHSSLQRRKSSIDIDDHIDSKHKNKSNDIGATPSNAINGRSNACFDYDTLTMIHHTTCAQSDDDPADDDDPASAATCSNIDDISSPILSEETASLQESLEAALSLSAEFAKKQKLESLSSPSSGSHPIHRGLTQLLPVAPFLSSTSTTEEQQPQRRFSPFSKSPQQFKMHLPQMPPRKGGHALCSALSLNILSPAFDADAKTTTAS
jgi:hypothetical protein